MLNVELRRLNHSPRYEALPRNVIFVALPLNGGGASGIPFPGRAWERENKQGVRREFLIDS